MNKNLKNRLILALLFIISCGFNSGAFAQADSSFSYQGQLLDNGSPANNAYDFKIEGLDGLGSTLGSIDTHLNVNVVNGLFNLDVDLGVDYFDGFEDYFLEISIRKSSVGGAYTTLGSLQTIQAVPLATNLINGHATAGQVLTFNGLQWNPATPSGGSGPWAVNGTEITYASGAVNIGDTSLNAQSPGLNVRTNSDLTASFNGGNRMYVFFQENGESRGYIGSFQDPANPGISNEDFEIGTSNLSTGKMHIVTGNNSPRITVTSTGNVGINSTSPTADFYIESNSDSDVIRVRVDGITKFYTDKNGGSSLGSYAVPPVDGLNVAGDTKQPSASNGLMKYMVDVKCSSSPSINKSFNGINNASLSVSAGSGTASCIIDFPSNIDNRYWQVSAVYASSNSLPGARSATCRIENPTTDKDKLRCERFKTDTAVQSAGDIMVLIY